MKDRNWKTGEETRLLLEDLLSIMAIRTMIPLLLSVNLDALISTLSNISKAGRLMNQDLWILR
jgi:hypothetical protein